MAEKLYKFFCEYCSFSKFTNGSDVGELVEIKRTPLQKSIKNTDEILKRKRKFKCPNCGNLLGYKKIKNQQDENDKEQEVIERLKRNAEKNIIEGH